jgi:nucleoid-associated protein EbfC
MNMMKLMQQAQQMQGKAAKMQAELATRHFEASAGGGAVKAVASGDSTLISLKIDPALFKEGDAEMLEDLVLTAVREALELGKKEVQAEMSKLTAGMGLPPGMF